MLDPSYVREHMAEVAAALRKRGLEASLEPFRKLDEERRNLLVQVEALKRERNELSRQIGGILKGGGLAEPLKQQTRSLGERIAQLESELAVAESGLHAVLSELPNIPDASVPQGASPEENRVERSWGEPRSFDFKPQAHWDLGTALGILDFERATRMTGARFALCLGDGARLERALIQFMLELHVTEHGYTEVWPPLMVNAQALYGTGQLPKFEHDLFKVEPGGYYLIPTAEVPLTNIHAEEILEAEMLPIAYCAYTPCFRSEAGSYGKDVRGLIRQHQFDKVELVRFCRPEDSARELNLLTAHAEKVLQRLGLPYRVVSLCSGDLGFAAAKTFDLEVWLAGQGVHREISSCSSFGDFQARRARIRYRPAAGAKPALLHTLNGSGLAVGRTFVALLEYYQQPDGGVSIPEALRPYMNGQERIHARR